LAQYSSPSSARETCNRLNGKFDASSDPIRKLPPLINRMLTLRAKTRPLRSGARLSRRESDRVLARRDNMHEGAGRARRSALTESDSRSSSGGARKRRRTLVQGRRDAARPACQPHPALGCSPNKSAAESPRRPSAAAARSIRWPADCRPKTCWSFDPRRGHKRPSVPR
jgi:hypothetical protein